MFSFQTALHAIHTIQQCSLTQPYHFQHDERAILGFRGTVTWADLVKDVQFGQKAIPSSIVGTQLLSRETRSGRWLPARRRRRRPLLPAPPPPILIDEHDRTLKFHAGFLAMYLKMQADLPKGGDQRFIVCGHSMGAAIACLHAFALGPTRVKEVYLFGAPRFANRAFCERYDAALGSVTYRIENDHDIVTHIPPLSSYTTLGTKINCAFDDGSLKRNHELENYQRHLRTHLKRNKEPADQTDQIKEEDSCRPIMDDDE